MVRDYSDVLNFFPKSKYTDTVVRASSDVLTLSLKNNNKTTTHTHT